MFTGYFTFMYLRGTRNIFDQLKHLNFPLVHKVSQTLEMK